MTNETHIEKIAQIAKEVARLHERLGVIRAALKMIPAGVEVARIVQTLDGVRPGDNETLRQQGSVKMEEVLFRYRADERATRKLAEAAMTLLMKKISEIK